ncbi:interleukin-21 receptor [Plectropomus leopardus]|uniref:interleukin-21 receptor n=1 Tax=Plectropomus leopardus TaxID=160734 RepID=UPI001C4D4F41|nr:interleukin-21 receptor [Plectropomus leopardus]
MSRPSGEMDWRSPPRLKLMLPLVFMLVSTNCLLGDPITGVDHKLDCVNDYLSTINCSLRITPSENNSTYWLTITEILEETKFKCMLTKTNEDYFFCSVQIYHPMPDEPYPDIFDDQDAFEISLCHKQNEPCEQLDKEYQPVKKIKPNAPRFLTVSHNSSQRHFTWKSTYEEYSAVIGLHDNLMYELHYYKRGDNHSALSHTMTTYSVNYTVDDRVFVSDTMYAARVRSSPKGSHYEGQWSNWSSEVYWETESAMNEIYLTPAVNVHTDPPSNTFLSGLGKAFIPIGVVMSLLGFLCYTTIKKWKQSAFIPTPAPYFHTLYTDCHGDFKSWVVTQENTADMLKAEETVQIDTLTKCAVVEEEECPPQFHHQFIEGSTYSNISNQCCDISLLGIPYAVSTMAPLSSSESSLCSLTLSSQPGSSAEGDSGCWLERDPPWYCNEYCTLSAFQQSSAVAAEHHESPSTKCCTTGTIRAETITEAWADVCK